MKYFTVLVCLSAVAALPADDMMVKKDDMSVKTDLLGQDVPLLKGIPRHDIANAYNATSEFEYWISHKPTDMVFAFADDDGRPINAVIEVPSATTSTLATAVKDKVRFHFFNKFDKLDVRGKKFETVDELKASNWNSELPVKVLVHGFINSIRSPAIQHIKNAYLKEGPHNVIGVDWGDLAGTDHLGLPKASFRYDLARNHVPAVGFRVGEMIDALIDAKLTDLKNVHIIGHSLGAHVAGIAGKSMIHGSPARITGLDPAGPLFWTTKPEGRLDHTDALFVDVMHTNAFTVRSSPISLDGYGHPARTGDIDFYVNGGHIQPQCLKLGEMVCSHNMAVDYFASTIGSGNEKKYEGFYCSTLPENSESCLSGQGTHRSLLKAFMGDKLSFVKLGPHYVDFKGLVSIV